MVDYTDVTLPAVFDDLDGGIALHHPETGAVLDTNERLKQLYGYAADELREMSIEAYTAPSTQFSEAVAIERIRSASDGNPQQFEWRVQRSNGELLWVRIHLNRTTIGGVDCVLAEVGDITEYKSRERRLRLLSRIVRHNLRNEMTLLMGYADRLKRALKQERLRNEAETVLEIASGVGTLSESVRQIEEIAEPNATERSPTDLRDVARRLVDDARSDYPEGEISIEAPEEVWVTADRGIVYAIEHAIENAIQHNDSGVPAVTVAVADQPDRGRAEVRIADNGPAIPEMEIDVLDDDVETTTTYHGSGVGLWVMRWCVDSHGGELSFAENSPRGNVVTISLPRADADSIATEPNCC